MEEAGGSSRRGAAFDRDWTKGSIIGNLWSLSWPMLISQSLNMLGPTIDMIWVGKLGAASVAGVGVAGMAVMLANLAMMGLTTGLRAMVARFVGAGDNEGANHIARQAFVIGAGYSIVVAVIGIFFAEPILMLMGLEADVVAEGAAYTRIMFVGSIAMSLRMMAEGTMQASGDTVMPMRITVLFRIFHVALCPFLIFGWWIFPHLGVSGAAATNVISQTLGLALGLWVLFKGRTRLRVTLSNFRLDLNIIWRIVKIGIPTAVMGVQRSLCLLALIWFIVPFGTLVVAAHTLCRRVENILSALSMGLGTGAGVLAGQNLGAGKPKRAEKSGWLAAGFAEGIMFISSAAILLWAENIVRVFTPEPGLIETTSTFLRITTAGYLALGFNMAFMQFLTGVGDTLPPMLCELLKAWLVQVPLAFLLLRVTTLGVYGVRWAMAAGMITAGTIFTVYFWLGRWKRKKV